VPEIYPRSAVLRMEIFAAAGRGCPSRSTSRCAFPLENPKDSTRSDAAAAEDSRTPVLGQHTLKMPSRFTPGNVP
jgi:hypothetical protein